jgi:hypothetical protein
MPRGLRSGIPRGQRQGRIKRRDFYGLSLGQLTNTEGSNHDNDKLCNDTEQNPRAFTVYWRMEKAAEVTQ